MDGAADLLALLPEVQDALSEDFDGIECSIGPGPVLSQSPFRQTFKYLGRQVTYVPDLSISCLEDADSDTMHKIPLTKNSAVFTDGLSGCCLELALGRGKDWKAPLIRLFDRLYPSKWAFFVAELEQSQPTFHLLCCGAAPVSSRREDTPDSTEQNSQVSSPTQSVSESTNFSLWIVPVTRIFAIPPPKKTKIVKKIVKKKSPSTTEIGEDGKEKKVRLVKKVKKERTGETPEREVSTPDGTGGTTSTAASTNGTPSTNGSTLSGQSSSTSVTTNGTNGGSGSNLVQNGSNGSVNGLQNGTASTSMEKIESESSSLSDLRQKLMGAMDSGDPRIYVNGEPRRLHPLRPSLSRKSMTPDKRLDPIYEGTGRKERSISPSKVVQREIVCRSTLDPSTAAAAASSSMAGKSHAEMPFIALQMVLANCFNYEQLGRLRLVHPHWDELAGQLLNSGYYKLLERSDNLLMALQRQLPSNAELHYPTTVLTSIQVHILNPVDIMRAVLDEGVCCFPYGRILDRAFLLLDQIEFMLHGGDQPKVDWEPVATLAKKAQLHYRTKMEKTMEDRLGENLRLKTAQRIIRLDSFMVDTTVAKLEKETAKARDDLRWEIEQLQTQNTQLKRDNRQLRQDQMKLDARVEILEQKFKTLARLLG